MACLTHECRECGWMSCDNTVRAWCPRCCGTVWTLWDEELTHEDWCDEGRDDVEWDDDGEADEDRH